MILLSAVALADTFEFSGVIPGSLTSNHVNQCEPNCAEQQNGGVGFSARYKASEKYLDIGIGRMYFINSFGDPGRVDWIQMARADADIFFINFGVSVWKMDIYGYKNAEGEPKVETLGAWPEFHAGADLLYFFDSKPLGIDSIYLERSFIQFPLVQVQHSRLSLQWNI
jgi:hypothetical protein